MKTWAPNHFTWAGWTWAIGWSHGPHRPPSFIKWRGCRHCATCLKQSWMWVLLSPPYERGGRGLCWLCDVPRVTSLNLILGLSGAKAQALCTQTTGQDEGAFSWPEMLCVIPLHWALPCPVGLEETEELPRSWLPAWGPVASQEFCLLPPCCLLLEKSTFSQTPGLARGCAEPQVCWGSHRHHCHSLHL